ncbi:hypothetical protein DUNSADRAFT_7149 [Dunaliella salina]|uniref:Uncharacterized protein n=1 Tax=Dunaliella salina TaxID=3046 RepID=A0ABQ7GLV8_DUNSA|nr:hypothetical protein DUNSADRAFT_7149 [Dunaliella salina]|eukprot:KAF5835601.1 hypothetical protein DUNSADRAFT_7149 [Dunaliella salina]
MQLCQTHSQRQLFKSAGSVRAACTARHLSAAALPINGGKQAARTAAGSLQRPPVLRWSASWAARQRQVPVRTAPQEQVLGEDGQPEEEELPWSAESLVALMEKMEAQGLKAHEMPEADWMLAAALASAPRMSMSQLARLLRAAVALELDVTTTAASASWLKPPSRSSSMKGDGGGAMGGSGEELWITHLLRESQNTIREAPAPALLDLMSTVLELQQQLLLAQAEDEVEAQDMLLLLLPGGDWLSAAITQLSTDSDSLSAPAAAGAVIVISELLAVTPSPADAGPWLDVLLLRMAESDAHAIPSSDMLTCAYLVASTHKHMPPQPYIESLFGEDGTCYRVDWEPEEAVALAVVCASFRCVPDLLWAKQVHMQTYLGLREMPGFLLAELAWALGFWQSAKAGTARGRFDYRPPASWWDEWFQATAPQLRSMAPDSCVRLVWAAATLELRPPEQWLLQLVPTILLHLQAGQHDPSELLYLTKAADMWWSQLLDSCRAVTAANSSPPLDPHSSTSSVPSSRRSSPSSSDGTQVVVMCGSPEVYEPPDQLSILVQDAFECLSQVSMPPQIWALDIRLVPPYAPIHPADDAALAEKLEAGAADGRRGWNAGGTPFLQSTAARRVYGPVPPPPV